VLHTGRESVRISVKQQDAEPVNTNIELIPATVLCEYMSGDREPVSGRKSKGVGMMVGMAIGVAAGSATENIGLWLAIGVALGAALETGLGIYKKA
jgi:hypothetical protein